MSKDQLYMKTAQEALRNSGLWLEEANTLLVEKKSYGHSCALSIYSIEEAVKAFVCFFVGIGVADKNETLVENVFRYHYTKMETVEMIALSLSSPLFSKAIVSELNRDELKELGDGLKQIEPYFENEICKLVKTRMNGIYVNIVRDKMTSPNDFSVEEAECFFFLASFLNSLVQYIAKVYQESDEKEREKRIENARMFANQLRGNIRRLRNQVE